MDYDNLPPLPNEMPDAVPVQEPGLLKSRTVQSLINQTQDLMARLTVALKRNIDLEQRLEDQKYSYDTLLAEYDVYKDHSRFFKERISQLEIEVNKLNDDKSETEKHFAQLYSQTEGEELKRKDLQRRHHRYQKYRVRVKKQVRPFIQSLKNRISEIETAFHAAQSQKLKQDELIKDLRQILESAVQHIQTQHKKYEKDQVELVNYHESKYKQTIEDLGRYKSSVEFLEKKEKQLEDENKSLAEKLFQLNETFSQRTIQLNQEYEARIHTMRTGFESYSLSLKDELDTKSRQFSENEIQYQNKIVLLERKYEAVKNEIDVLTQDFNTKRLNLSSQAHSLEINLKSAQTDLEETKSKLSNTETENQQLRDQLDSLQLLYNENLSHLEDAKHKISAADKINKDLSGALNEQRKKSETLAEKLAQAESTFDRRLSAMGNRFQQETVNLHKKINDGKTSSVTAGNTELISKIQILLSEIQSGYSIVDENTSTAQLESENGDVS